MGISSAQTHFCILRFISTCSDSFVYVATLFQRKQRENKQKSKQTALNAGMWADLVLMWLWTPHRHKQMESAERMKKSTEKNAGEGKTARLGEKGRGISLAIQLSSLSNKLRGKEEGRVSRALQESGEFSSLHVDNNSRQKYNLQEQSSKTFFQMILVCLVLAEP